MNVVDHRRFGAMSSARAHKGTVAGGAERTRTCGPAVAVCVGACASQPAALEAWRVLVWLITGKHGAEKREPGGLALFFLQPLTTVHVYISCTFLPTTHCVYVKYRSAC